MNQFGILSGFAIEKLVSLAPQWDEMATGFVGMYEAEQCIHQQLERNSALIFRIIHVESRKVIRYFLDGGEAVALQPETPRRQLQ